jgi:tetratricopeptide (TPR) repeat protein
LIFRRLLTAFPAGRFAERAAWKVGWRAYRFGSKAEAARVFEAAATTFPRSDYRPAYVYWAARALESLGQHELAASRYALVRIDYLHSYYGRLAARALEQRALPLRASFETIAVSSDEPRTTMAALPPTAEIIRFLLSAGLYDDALNELRYAQHAWGDAAVLQATLGWVHHQRGDVLVGANVAKRAYPQYLSADGDSLPSELLAVIFPMGYWNLLRQHAATHQLDPYLLASPGRTGIRIHTGHSVLCESHGVDAADAGHRATIRTEARPLAVLSRVADTSGDQRSPWHGVFCGPRAGVWGCAPGIGELQRWRKPSTAVGG